MTDDAEKENVPLVGESTEANTPSKQTLDSRCNMQKTPGNRPGAGLPFEDLLKQKIEEHVSKTMRDLYVHLSDS